MWTNLIDNAVQAMDGEGTLTIRTSLDGDCVRVEIGDTGPGMPAELRQRIFEPFFTTKPVGQGTGLGLDISYRIVVARHGGDLSVESEPGDTRFIVRLPLTERPRPECPGSAEQEGAAGAAWPLPPLPCTPWPDDGHDDQPAVRVPAPPRAAPTPAGWTGHASASEQQGRVRPAGHRRAARPASGTGGHGRH